MAGGVHISRTNKRRMELEDAVPELPTFHFRSWGAVSDGWSTLTRLAVRALLSIVSRKALMH